MKFKVDKSTLWEKLQTVLGVVPQRTTFPILTNVLLEAKKDHLKLAATDLDISIVTGMPVEVTERGEITLPGRKLGEIVRELPEVPISFSVANSQATFKCDKGVFKLTGIERGEYPELPELDRGRSLSLDGESLNRAVEKTSFAAASDEMRPALSGVLWQIRERDMRMVATDGHRLALLKLINILDKPFSLEITVPPKALNQLGRLTGGKQPIEVRLEESKIGFYFNGNVITARLVEGTFPDYEQVIPKDNDKVARLEREPFISALRRVAVFSNPDTHLTKLSFDRDSLQLHTHTPEFGEAREEIPCRCQGEKIEIGYNASYLLDVLTRIDSEEVVVSLKDPLSAGTISPSEQKEAEELLYLLMPIRMGE